MHTLFHLPILKLDMYMLIQFVDVRVSFSTRLLYFFLLFLPASISYRLLCGQGSIMACIQSGFSNKHELELLFHSNIWALCSAILNHVILKQWRITRNGHYTT